MRVLVSACLLGKNCKYNGGNNDNPKVRDFLKGKEAIAICPEQLSGMPVPRPCVEIVNGILIDENGKIVDGIYRRGVEAALRQIAGLEIDLAILQARSPTCGVNQVYDGTFSGRLIPGQGIFAQALRRAGYQVMDSQEFAAMEEAEQCTES